MELPGVDKNELKIEAKANTIRISGKKIGYSDGASVHRRERISGEFDRTLSLPVEVDPNGIKAEYRDGLLALFLPRAESDKPLAVARELSRNGCRTPSLDVTSQSSMSGAS